MWYLFWVQVLYYLFLVVNTHAISTLSASRVAVTDVAIATVQFWAIQKVARSERLGDFVAYVMGSLVGSLLGVVVASNI